MPAYTKDLKVEAYINNAQTTLCIKINFNKNGSAKDWMPYHLVKIF